jgi:serine/threonine-protein kinase RsbW
VATVELRFTPLAAHVRTARLVAVSLARRAGIEDDVLDEVRLAVGEAATRAVGRHLLACPGEPVLVRLTDGDGRFVAEVVDRAAEPTDGTDATDGTDGTDGTAAATTTPADAVPVALAPDVAIVDDLVDELPPGVDLAVIGGLVDDVSVEAGPAGSVVTMAWPVPQRASGQLARLSQLSQQGPESTGNATSG